MSFYLFPELGCDLIFSRNFSNCFHFSSCHKNFSALCHRPDARRSVHPGDNAHHCPQRGDCTHAKHRRVYKFRVDRSLGPWLWGSLRHLFSLLRPPASSRWSLSWRSRHVDCLGQMKANWKRRLLFTDLDWQHHLARSDCATPCWQFSQGKKSVWWWWRTQAVLRVLGLPAKAAGWLY